MVGLGIGDGGSVVSCHWKRREEEEELLVVRCLLSVEEEEMRLMIDDF